MYNSLIYRDTYVDKTNHSSSFYLIILLSIYMLLYCYLNIFFIENKIISYLLLAYLVFITIFLFFLSLFGKNQIKGRTLFLFLSFICFSFLSFLKNFSGGENLLGLICILLGISILTNDPLREKEWNFAFAFFLIFVFLLLLKGATVDSVGDGKLNPNTCGFYLTLVFIVCLIFKGKIKNYVRNLLLIICIIGQFFFASRSAFLGMVIFLLLLILSKYIRRCLSKRKVFYSIIFLSFFGIIAAYVYSEILYPIIGNNKIYLFGKDLFTGRQTIWHNAFNSIREHFWFGIGNSLNEDLYDQGYAYWITNAHNQPIGIFATFGAFSFFLFYVCLAWFVAKPYQDTLKPLCDYYAVFFIWVVTIMSYFEIYFIIPHCWAAILIVYGLISTHSNVISKGECRIDKRSCSRI